MPETTTNDDVQFEEISIQELVRTKLFQTFTTNLILFTIQENGQTVHAIAEKLADAAMIAMDELNKEMDALEKAEKGIKSAVSSTKSVK